MEVRSIRRNVVVADSSFADWLIGGFDGMMMNPLLQQLTSTAKKRQRADEGRTDSACL